MPEKRRITQSGRITQAGRTGRAGASASLLPYLVRGAVLSPFKRPGPGARLPEGARLTVPGVRADPRRLARYAQLCGFPAGGAVPVTYPHVLGFPSAMRLMSSRAFPLPVLGLVHTTFRVRQHRALTPDEALDLTVYADALTPHRRGTEAHLVTEVRTGGELVWESRSTYLARHAVPAAAEEPAGPAAADGGDAAVQQLPVRAEWQLPGDLGRRYAAVSGDRNPIHLHPLSARLFGFPRAIAHGMWTVARCLAEHGTQHGARGAVAAEAAFRRPVLLPSAVRYAADGAAFALLGGRDGTRVHLTGSVTGGDTGR